MKMCIDRPEELSLGLSMHQDETSGTCYVWPVGLVASMGSWGGVVWLISDQPWAT